MSTKDGVPGLEEAVEAARRGLELATEATAAAFSSQSLSQIEAPLTAYHKFASRHFPIVARALLALTRGDGRELGVPLGRDDSSDEHSRWLPIAGVPRDELPGTLIGWCVGSKEHSDATWRREGQAILTLDNTGPLGFSLKTIQHARWLLDMDTIDTVSKFRRLPSPPQEDQRQ